jgi:hypothetical protein
VNASVRVGHSIHRSRASDQIDSVVLCVFAFVNMVDEHGVSVVVNITFRCLTFCSIRSIVVAQFLILFLCVSCRVVSILHERPTQDNTRRRQHILASRLLGGRRSSVGSSLGKQFGLTADNASSAHRIDQGLEFLQLSTDPPGSEGGIPGLFGLQRDASRASSNELVFEPVEL